MREEGSVIYTLAKAVRGIKRSSPIRAIASAKKEIRDDVMAIMERDPAAKSCAEVLLLYPGLHAVLAHRVAHKLYVKDHTLLARAVSQGARFFTGIEIHPGATIGRGLVIDHGSGVVIGETCEIGDNCTLYQGVTLGGTGKDAGKRHPTLRDNVMVGAGAKVLGPIVIESNSKIAANAVVLKDIPSACTAVGIPARVARHEGKRIDRFDQVHIPDPVAQEISRLEQKINELQSELDSIKKSKTKVKKEKV